MEAILTFQIKDTLAEKGGDGKAVNVPVEAVHRIAVTSTGTDLPDMRALIDSIVTDGVEKLLDKVFAEYPEAEATIRANCDAARKKAAKKKADEAEAKKQAEPKAAAK